MAQSTSEVASPTVQNIKVGWLTYIGNLMVPYGDRVEWLREMRGNLCLVATIIATLTFQVVFNPLGGVRPVKDTGDDIPCTEGNKNITYKLCPGEAVFGVVYPDQYLSLLFRCTICLLISLTVCILLVVGIPINHRIPVYLLSMAMWGTLTSLAHTYLLAMSMTTPKLVWDLAANIQENMIYTWLGLSSALAVYLTSRFFYWVYTTCKSAEPSTTPTNTAETPELLDHRTN